MFTAIIDIVSGLVKAANKFIDAWFVPRKVDERAKRKCDEYVGDAAESIEQGKADKVSLTLKQSQTDNPVEPRKDLKQDIDAADEDAVNKRLKGLTDSL